MTFPDAGAQALLAEAGAAVDAATGRVRIPPRLVEEALAAAPRDVLLAGRDAAHDVRCDGTDVHLTLDGTGAYTLDHRTGERRPSTMQDLADASLVADAADEVGVVWNIVSAADAPPNTQVLDELAAIVSHTGKHIQGEVQRAEEVPYVLEILAAAADGGAWDPARPFFSIVYCPVPPLQHEPEMLGAGLALARAGVPTCIYSMGLTGATAPVTLAGAVMQANAEILSSIVLFQLARPGLGCIYVADTGVLDMRSGAYAAAAPESVLITQAMVGHGPSLRAPGHGDGPHRRRQRVLDDERRRRRHDGAHLGADGPGPALRGRHARRRADALAAQDPAGLRALPAVPARARRAPGGRRAAARGARRPGRPRRPLPARPRDARLPAPRRAAAAAAAAARAVRGVERGARRGPRPAAEVQRATAAVEEILATHRPKPLPAGAEERIADVIAAAGRELTGR